MIVIVDNTENTVQKYCLSVFHCKTKAGGRQQNGKEMFSNETWSAFSVGKMWIKAATRQQERKLMKQLWRIWQKTILRLFTEKKIVTGDIIFSMQCHWSICCFCFCSCLFKLLALGHVVASYFRKDKMKTNV